MATNPADRVQQTTTGTGTGPLTPTGAVTGMRSFAAAYPSTTALIPYLIEGISPTTGLPMGDWESGFGTWNGTALVRDTVTASSNNGAAVNFGAGTKTLSVSLTAAAFADKADKGPIATSGLTAPGLGLIGRTAAGVGAMGLIFLGAGLALVDDTLQVTAPTAPTSFVPVEGADPTEATASNAAFTIACRRACGLADDGTGTQSAILKAIKPPPGRYRLDAWQPLDAAGNPISQIIIADPGTVTLTNRLRGPGSGLGAGVAVDANLYQFANRPVQQVATEVFMGRSPRTFYVASAAAQDDLVSAVRVPNALAYKLNSMVKVNSEVPLPYTLTGAAKARIAECARVLDVDPVASVVYLHTKLAYHHLYRKEYGLLLTQMDERLRFEHHDIMYGAAPTTIGNTTATPDTLDHGIWGFVQNQIVSITKSGLNVTVVTQLAHNLVTGNRVRVQGFSEPVFNITNQVTVLSPTSFRYTLRDTSDNVETFSPAPAAVADGTRTEVGTYYNDAFPNLDGTSHNACIEVENVVNPWVVRPRMKNPWNQGLRFVNCPEPRIVDVDAFGSPNHGTSIDNEFFGSRLGYVVSFNGCCNFGTVSRFVSRNARHFYTSGSPEVTGYDPTNSAAASAWMRTGTPTYITLSDGYCYDGWGLPIDVHEDEAKFTWRNIRLVNSRKGPGGGSYAGNDVQFRGCSGQMFDCSSYGASTSSIRITATEIPGEPIMRIRSNSTTPFYEPLTYSVTSLTRSGTTATLIYGNASSGQTIPCQLVPGDSLEVAGANEANYNMQSRVLTHDTATRTLTFTLPTHNILNDAFPTAPGAAPTTATGTMLMTPYLRNEHTIHNYHCSSIGRRSGSVFYMLDQSALRFRTRARITGSLVGLNVGNLIDLEPGTIANVASMYGGRINFDTNGTPVESGRGFVVRGDAQLSIGHYIFDASENPTSAPALYPGGMRDTSSVQIGHMEIWQHPNQPLLVPAIIEDQDNVAGKRLGIGRITLKDPANLDANFRIVTAGRESNFTWTGGGQTYRIPIRGGKEIVGASEANLGWTTMQSRLLVWSWQARTRTNAAAAITADVLRDGVSIFGATKPVIAAGQRISAAPTYDQMFIAPGRELTVSTTTTGTESAQGLDVLAIAFEV